MVNFMKLDYVRVAITELQGCYFPLSLCLHPAVNTSRKPDNCHEILNEYTHTQQGDKKDLSEGSFCIFEQVLSVFFTQYGNEWRKLHYNLVKLTCLSEFQEHVFVSDCPSEGFSFYSHDTCCVGLQSTHKIKACFVAAASKYNQVCELRCIYIYLTLITQRCTE